MNKTTITIAIIALICISTSAYATNDVIITYKHAKDIKTIKNINHQYQNIKAISTNLDNTNLKALKKNKNIQIEKNQIFKTALIQSEPLIGSDIVNQQQINGINIKGDGETACMVDSGINYMNENLGSCTTEIFLTGNCSKVIGGYDFYNNDPDPMDDNSHGTYLAGIVAANGPIKGIAPNSKIVSVKVCDSNGVCYMDDILNGIDWCITNAKKYNITSINIPLASIDTYATWCDSQYLSLSNMINEAVSNNISVFAASGNNAQTTSISSPACIENVISVGATKDDGSDTIYWLSNIGPILNLFAPGAVITSAKGINETYDMSGTSAAASHATASSLLIHQYFLLLNEAVLQPKEIKYLLIKGGQPTTYNIPRISISKSITFINTINKTENSIYNKNGKIIFNQPVDLIKSSVYFQINNNNITLDNSQLSGPANIELYHISYEKIPIILKDGTQCDNCSPSYENGILKFSVSSFSNYTLMRNSDLTIYSVNTSYKNENVEIYANYTNLSSRTPISTGICLLNGQTMMNYENGLYIYNKTFQTAGNHLLNITCSDDNFETLTKTSTITILPSCGLPLPGTNWIIENDNVTCENETLNFQNQQLIIGPNATFNLINSNIPSSTRITINESSVFNIINSNTSYGNIFGYGNITIINSKIGMYLDLKGNSIINNSSTTNTGLLGQSNIISSNIYYLRLYKYSETTITNTNVTYRTLCYGNSSATINNSTINEIILGFQGNPTINFAQSNIGFVRLMSNNTIINLNRTTITRGLLLHSNYDEALLTEQIQNLSNNLTREGIYNIANSNPIFNNITIMNGNFVDCDIGMNLSLIKNIKITNNTFTNCQNGIIAGAINSEITGNKITIGSSSSGSAIVIGGMDNIVSSNEITGNYQNGIAMLGLNTTADSNKISGSNYGIGIIGFYDTITRNNITNTTNAINGMFVLGANISGNRLDTNENGISMVCFDTSVADSNVIISSSNKAMELRKFLKAMCSKDSNITNNKLISQTKPAINIMGTLIENDTIIYNNNLINNTYCDDEEICN